MHDSGSRVDRSGADRGERHHGDQGNERT
jgi:hypothetical protein